MRTALGAALVAASMAMLSTPAVAAYREAGAPATANEAHKIALARQIVDLGYPEARREALFFASMDQMVMQMRQATLSSLPDRDEGAMAIVDQWLAQYVSDSKEVLRSHLPSIMNAIALAYANMFTEAELRDIHAFVSTSSGQRFFELSPAILGEPNFARANQAYMNDIMDRLPGAQKELEDELRDYFLRQDAETSSTPS